MVGVFPKSANQPNEMAISRRNCSRLMRDWKLENLPSGKEVCIVPFRTKKEDYHWKDCTIYKRKITVYLAFNRNLQIFLPNNNHPLLYGSVSQGLGTTKFTNLIG